MITIIKEFKNKKLNKAMLTDANSKLGPLIKNFPIAIASCRHATEHCEKYCYAKRGKSTCPTTQYRYNLNYEYSKRSNFVELMNAQVQLAVVEGYKYIRLHACGDFYSNEYYMKWVEIAKCNPKMTILAYTRNYEIDFSLAPSNFRLFYSVDPSSKKMNTTAKRFAYVVYDIKNGVNKHLSKYLHNNITGKICNSKCKMCKYCYKTEGNVIFPGRNVKSIVK